MEVPRLGVETELQLLADTTATAARDPSCVCDLYHSSWQCWVLNPLSEPMDGTHISRILVGFINCWATKGTLHWHFFCLHSTILVYEVVEKKLSGALLLRFHTVVVCSLSNHSAGVPRRPSPWLWIRVGPRRSPQGIWKRKWGCSHYSEWRSLWFEGMTEDEDMPAGYSSPPSFVLVPGILSEPSLLTTAAWGPPPNSRPDLHPSVPTVQRFHVLP